MAKAYFGKMQAGCPLRLQSDFNLYAVVFRGSDDCMPLGVQEEIDQHRATLDPDNPRDFIDSYLLEMEEKKNDPESTCSGKSVSSVPPNQLHSLQLSLSAVKGCSF